MEVLVGWKSCVGVGVYDCCVVLVCCVGVVFVLWWLEELCVLVELVFDVWCDDWLDWCYVVCDCVWCLVGYCFDLWLLELDLVVQGIWEGNF